MTTEDMELENLITHFNSFEQQALDLIVENEALKAQTEEFRVELDYINSFMAENTEYELFKELYDWGKRTDLLLLKTPEQCLNSVKADAINSLIKEMGGCDHKDEGIIYIEDAELYIKEELNG